jgi:hypothetical protein
VCKVDCGGAGVAFRQGGQGRAVGREVFDEGKDIFGHVLAGEQELVGSKSGICDYLRDTRLDVFY